MKTTRRLDASALIGAAIAVTGIVAGLRFEGLSLYDVAQPAAALVVFLGTAGAALISVPRPQIRGALSVFRGMLFDSAEDPRYLVDRFVAWSRMTRLRGVASLEAEVEQIDDPVLRKSMRLVVDAVGETEIGAVMELEIRGIERAAEAAAQFYETAAGYAPTLGIVGAAIGLIQVMKHLDRIEQMGTGIAAAFVATIYGILLANLILLPVATRIRAQCLHRVRTCRVIAQGVLCIAGSLNPTLLRLSLETLLQVPETDARDGVMAMPVLSAEKS